MKTVAKAILDGMRTVEASIAENKAYDGYGTRKEWANVIASAPALKALQDLVDAAVSGDYLSMEEAIERFEKEM